MVKVSLRKLVHSPSYVCDKTPVVHCYFEIFAEMSNFVFVPVINLYASNLHSTKSRIIKVYLFFLQNISKYREFTELSHSDKKKKMLITTIFMFMSLFCELEKNPEWSVFI